MSSQSDEAVEGSSLDLEIESIESVVSISSILEHLDSALNEVDSSVSKVNKEVPVVEDLGVDPAAAEEKEGMRKAEDSTKKVKSAQCVAVEEEEGELSQDANQNKSYISFSDDGEDEHSEDDHYKDDLYGEDAVDDDYIVFDELSENARIVSALVHDSSEEEEEEAGESKSEVENDDEGEESEEGEEGEEGEEVDEDYGILLAGNAGGDNDDGDHGYSVSATSKTYTPPVVNKKNKFGGGGGGAQGAAAAAVAANDESFDEATPSRKAPRNFGVNNAAANSRFAAKPPGSFRGRRPPFVQRNERLPMPGGPRPQTSTSQIELQRRNSSRGALNHNGVMPYRRGGGNMTPLKYGPTSQRAGEAEDGSSLFISNWGFRSNLIDQNGNFQRATTDLKNYIVSYKSKYLYFFDLVNGRYPQYVRTLPNKMEIWRMSFNVYASGFSEYISHLGEIHCFYQMEMVNDELRWVYKDFNFYPNRMRYGFRVNTFDIADVHSRFIKFVCVRDNIIKQFPYVEIHHKVFIGKKFDNNVRNMLNRLKTVTRDSDDN